jgi:hypothetical protein
MHERKRKRKETVLKGGGGGIDGCVDGMVPYSTLTSSM